MARKTYKKVIVTPELLAQVNPKNIELRDLFLKEKNARSSEYRSKGNWSGTEPN